MMHRCKTLLSISDTVREFGINLSAGQVVDLDEVRQGVTLTELIEEGSIDATHFEEIAEEEGL